MAVSSGALGGDPGTIWPLLQGSEALSLEAQHPSSFSSPPDGCGSSLGSFLRNAFSAQATGASLRRCPLTSLTKTHPSTQKQSLESSLTGSQHQHPADPPGLVALPTFSPEPTSLRPLLFTPMATPWFGPLGRLFIWTPAVASWACLGPVLPQSWPPCP